MIAESQLSLTGLIHLDESTLSLTREIAHEFFEESQLPGHLNYDYWCGCWKKFFDLCIGTIILYMGAEGGVKGIMGGLCVPCTMTGELTASEMFWYVRPQYRGSPAGIRLLHEFERWGKAKGAKRVQMVHLEAISPGVMQDIYLRMGYTPLQRAYHKAL